MAGLPCEGSELTPATVASGPLKVNYLVRSPMIKLSYYWDFGDGSTSMLPAPGHAFTRSGTYTVRLTWRVLCVDQSQRLGNGCQGVAAVKYRPITKVCCSARRLLVAHYGYACCGSAATCRAEEEQSFGRSRTVFGGCVAQQRAVPRPGTVEASDLRTRQALRAGSRS
jgi:hypothetical protein